MMENYLKIQRNWEKKLKIVSKKISNLNSIQQKTSKS